MPEHNEPIIAAETATEQYNRAHVPDDWVF